MFMYYLANQMSGEDVCEIIINHLKQKRKQTTEAYIFIFQGLNPGC